LELGGAHLTCAPALEAAACTDEGAPGTVKGVPEAGGPASPRPAPFSAETVKLYDVPLANPSIVVEVELPDRTDSVCPSETRAGEYVMT
jgi:hypothetical protein